MKVAVCADASLDTGTGHIMRCLIPADALRARRRRLLLDQNLRPDMQARAHGFGLRR